MLWLLLLPLLAYILLVATAAVLIRTPLPSPPLPATWPRIAVLVAARDEEAALPACLDALLAQDYPADRFAIYIADDHSTDGTARIVRAYAERDARVHYVAVPDLAPERTLRGKALALHTAFAQTDADLWLTTDADCRPPPGWARHIVPYFSDPAVGAVSGVTTTTTATPFAHAQALDWLYLLGALGFLAEKRHPVTAMGNNLALRPAAYRAVGGYPALPFSVTEDYALFRAIYRHPGWRVRSPLDAGLHNRTLPLATFAEVLTQRKRWVRGGLRGAWWLYPIYLAVGLTPLVPLALLFVAPLVGGAALLARLAADAAFLRPLARRFGVPWSARAFLRFELIHHLYLVALPWLLLFRPRIAWKGRVHG